MFSISFDTSDPTYNDLILRIRNEKKNTLNKNMNFIIYDNRADGNFGKIDQQLLLKRYVFLDHIYDHKKTNSTLIEVLLLKMNSSKLPIQIIKEPKIGNLWEKTDTKYPSNDDDRSTIYSNVNNVEINDYGIPKGAILSELRGHQLGKLKLIAQNNENNDLKNTRKVNIIDVDKVNTPSKRKLLDIQIPDDVLFVYPFKDNIKERNIITNDFHELDGKTCSLNDNAILWTSSIEIDSITLPRENVTSTATIECCVINKTDKERIFPVFGVEFSMAHWLNDALINFWMIW